MLDAASVNQAAGSADYEPDGLKLSVAMGTVFLSVIIDTTNKKYNQEIPGTISMHSRTDFKGKYITLRSSLQFFFTIIFQVPLSLIELSVNKLAQLFQKW